MAKAPKPFDADPDQDRQQAERELQYSAGRGEETRADIVVAQPMGDAHRQGWRQPRAEDHCDVDHRG
ncbi:hypothetical protein D3C71_1980340 [compost metagenome]